MLDPAQFEQEVAALSAQLRAKLSVRGKSLSTRLARAGRRLPAPVQQAGAVITQAQPWVHHPKMWRLVSGAEVEAAFAKIRAHLGTIDPVERRKGALLGLAADLVFKLLVIAAALIGVLVWRGFL